MDEYESAACGVSKTAVLSHGAKKQASPSLPSITIQDMKPKLTLRDLFWLVLVCAMGCAWGLERKQTSDLNADKRVFELESAQRAEHYRHLDRLNRLLEAKLKEEGYHWEPIQGYRQDGTPYLYVEWFDRLPDLE